MGNSTSQTYHSVQDVQNDIVQVSEQYCEIAVDQDFSNNTIIIVGGSGSVTFKQRAVIENATCNMTQSLDNSIENILESMASQDATAKGGFSINWSDVDQDISIYQYVKNSVTQIMVSSCNISASQTFNNNYIYVEDYHGDIYFSQEAEITNATCNMNSAATNQVYNSTKSEGDQTSKAHVSLSGRKPQGQGGTVSRDVKISGRRDEDRSVSVGRFRRPDKNI